MYTKTLHWSVWLSTAVVTATTIVGWWSVAGSDSALPSNASVVSSHEVEVVELRGVWSGYRVEPDWDTAAQKLSAANFNAIFPYVCSPGIAYYHSQVLPVSQLARQHDYLAEAVTAAHKHDITVHARMLTLEMLFGTDPVKDAFAEAGRLMSDSQGKTAPWLCPTDPRNRQLLGRIVSELVTDYDIDGLQFDYLRYPGRDYCLCQRCRRQFAADTGVRISQWPQDVLPAGPLAAQFNRWRQQQLTALLSQLVVTARAVRPDIVVSASVFPRWEEHSARFGQDAANWVEPRVLDFVAPMNYTEDRLDFATWLLTQRKAISGRVPLVVGMGPLSDACQFDSPEQLVEQIEIARSFGAGGFIIFKYTDQFAREYLPYLAEEATAQPAGWQTTLTGP